MKPKMLSKWIVGISGTAALAAFLGLTTDMENRAGNEGAPWPSVGQTPQSTITPAFSPPVSENIPLNQKQDREAWIASLNWNEEDWDVNVSNGVMTAVPKNSQNRLEPAQQRTRRS